MNIFEILDIKYEYYDPNPNHDISYNDDLYIRSFTKLLNLSYEEVYDDFCKIARSIFISPTDRNIWYSYVIKNSDLDSWNLNDFYEAASMGSIIDDIKDCNIKCIFISRDRKCVTYFENDTIYDKFALIGKRLYDYNNHHYIGYKKFDCALTKASVDEHLGQIIEYIVAYKDDIDKIKDLLKI